MKACFGRAAGICLVLVGVLLGGNNTANTAFAAVDKPGDAAQRPEALVLLPMNINAVLVEKSSQQVFLYSSNSGGVYERFRIPCSTGAAAGNKFKSGDKKTPEGVYFLTDEYEDRYLSPVYGKKAFPTDYPNFLDRQEGKGGYAIWLHGTNKQLKPMDSNGCVAMKDKDILRLAEYISPGTTPVVMVDSISFAAPENIDRERRALLSFASTWGRAIGNGTYQEYLSLYDPAYLPNIQWWNQWWKLRSQAAGEGLKFRISMDSPGIYREKNVFVLFFDMGIELGEKRVPLGKRKLFVKKNDDSYRITGDLFQTFPKGKSADIDLIASVAKGLYRDVGLGHSLRKSVDAWLAAWSSKDMNTYAGFYSNRFFSDGMNKTRWVARKRRLAGKYDTIKVAGSNFRIDKGENRSVVSFLQDYRSDHFKEKGVKTLVLIQEEGVWKIYRESWKKN
ncbi:MAG: L,D-transpeptidase family protein [Desulfobacteraceae bacterium]|nr:L,D-transpeptidase family protein [Desulfobacteraceae bacterium]